MKYFLFLLAIILFSMINVGCTSASHKYIIKEKAYVPAPAPSQNETRVFVIRGNNFAAAAGRFVIIDNDTLVGALDRGNFTSFVTKANRNVVVVAIPIPLGARSYVYFDGRQGKDVYLYFNVVLGGSWVMQEINEKEAQELMSKYQYQELQGVINTKWDVNFLDYYDRLQQQKAN